MKKNIIANFIGRFWSVLSNFLFVPLYIHVLGLESYSIISFTLVLNGIMAMMDAGLTATLSREFASNKNSIAERIQIFNTLESFYFLMSGFVIILLLAVSGSIAFKWLNLDNIQPGEASLYFKIISVEIGLRLLGNFYSGGFIGLEKQVKSNMYQVFYGVVRNGLVLIPISFYPSLKLFFLWQVITTLLYVVIIRYDLNFILTNTTLSFFKKPKIEMEVILKVWKFAGGMMLISMVAGLNTQMDKLALSRLMPIEVLGLYTLAFALSNGLSFISAPVSTAILPRMTALFTAGKKMEAVRIFNLAYSFVSIVVFSFAAGLIVFAKDLIWIWTNNSQLAEKAYIYVPWIAAGTAFLALQNLPFNVAIANGFTKYNNILGLTSLLITMPGYWILTKIYGGIGAAITYSFVQVFIGIVYILLVNRRFMQLETKKLFLKNFFFPILISVSVTLALSHVISFKVNHRLILFLEIGFVVGCSLIFNVLVLAPSKVIRIFKK
ncbi:oligosaccharide flippase family protein [bacterium]|nr:oligosaccharide flippase family protein [bacterium]